MPTRRVAPYGSWASEVTATRVAGASLKLGQAAIDGDTLYWSEGRPEEKGRTVIVRATLGGVAADVTPPPWNARSRAHEYGGGAFLVAGGEVFFSHFEDQQIYRIDGRAVATRLTSSPACRYADAVLDRRRQRLITVQEDHGGGSDEPVNRLVGIDLADGAEHELASGHDFYASPCLSADGDRLAWLTWDHPQMPWDGTELWVATLSGEGNVSLPVRVAGGPAESIFQPAWSPSGELHFVSDRSGWWNLYRLRGGNVEALYPRAAEFGEPQWLFGMSTYGFDAVGRLVCTFVEDGISQLASLDPARGEPRRLATQFTAIRELKVGADFIAFFGGSPTLPEALVRLDLRSGHETVVRSSGDAAADATGVSRGKPFDYPARDGEVAHAFHYPPCNPAFEAPAAERPPLIVMDHGGPTGATTAALRWAVQFWTQRGFAVVDVNYGGSTGFGRAYRERLKGRWGIVDVEDSIDAARCLVARGEVDPARVVIRGSSAGGYTTLAALTFHDFFAAGASHYGIGDLEALARDTHKFESRYLDGLVGPYPAAAARYRERSPVHHVDRLSSALILLQGAEDKVVPPAQAEAMHAAVRARGLPVAYLLFEHEQHGFRRAENIRRALEAELFFYGRVLGFTPADRIEPVPIANLPVAEGSGVAAAAAAADVGTEKP